MEFKAIYYAAMARFAASWPSALGIGPSIGPEWPDRDAATWQHRHWVSRHESRHRVAIDGLRRGPVTDRDKELKLT